MGWMFGIALGLIGENEESIAEWPNIKPGEEFEGYATAAPVRKPQTP